MPALLRSLGIRDWIISPLLKIGKEACGGPAGDRRRLFDDLLTLHYEAKRFGVQLTVDDEFDRLDYRRVLISKPKLAAIRVRTLPKGTDIFRLVPSGHCSMGTDILRQVGPDTPRWIPGKTNGGAFLAALKNDAA